MASGVLGIVYLSAVLVGGVAANRLRHGGAPPYADQGRARDRWDLFAWVVVGLAVVLRLLDIGVHDITGDEASALEPSFWSDWFFSFESLRNPPLFRFLIHTTPLCGEVSLFRIRAPAAVFGAVSVGLLYVLARRRAPGPWAVAAAAVLAVTPLHLRYSGEEKAYTLWLCLLLLSQISLERALDGERRHWMRYSAWMTCAALTHYLTPFYAAGQLFHVWAAHRSELRSHVAALAPTVLAIAPFVALIAYRFSEAATPGHESGWIAAALSQVRRLPGAGGLVLLLLIPGLRGRGFHAGHLAAIPWMCLFGAAGGAVAGAGAVRYFFPILPFALAGIAAGAGAGWIRFRRARAVAAGFLLMPAFFSPATAASEVDDWLSRRGTRAIVASYIASAATPSRHLAIFPPAQFQTTLYALTSRRDWSHTGCQGGAAHLAFRSGSFDAFAIGGPVTAESMDALAARLGSVDVFRLRPSIDAETAPDAGELDPWLVTRCSKLASAGPPGRSEHAVFRCGSSPPAAADVCQIRSELPR